MYTRRAMKKIIDYAGCCTPCAVVVVSVVCTGEHNEMFAILAKSHHYYNIQTSQESTAQHNTIPQVVLGGCILVPARCITTQKQSN